MRSNVQPSSNKNDRKNNQPFVFNSFSKGTIKDPPAGKINDCLADSMNITTYPTYYEGRTGSILYTDAKPPALEGFTDIMAHKSGSHIISDSGSIFTQEHIGCFFCFGDQYELMVDYVSGTEMIGSDTDYKETVNGHIIGTPNIFDFHTSLKQWYLMLGREFYYADLAISRWNSILTISRDIPFSSESGYVEYKKKLLVFNGNGIYKVDFSASYPVAYKVNVDPPNIRILSVDQESGYTHRYRYLYSAMRIANDGDIVDRQTPSFIDLETGTCVPDSDNIDYAEVWTDEDIDSSHPNLVQTLRVPVIANTNPVEYQWHLTHYPIYRTPDLEAINPLDVNKTEYNDPSRFVWVKDLRICAAFYGYILGNRVYLTYGQFEVADTFCVLELDDGQRFEIEEVVSEDEAIIDTDYYDYNIGPCAMMIGNGRVFRGSVAGNILTRTHGSEFTEDDVRKTLWNSQDYKLYITEYIDENRVGVHINGDQPVQGFTTDPTYRQFYDTISDETLQARKDFYSCDSRFREALPNCNMGDVFPGFLVCGFRGQRDIYYHNLIDEKDYLIGQHVKIQTSDAVLDSIMAFWRFRDVFSIICVNSVWSIQIGLSNFTTLPGSNESIAILPTPKETVIGMGCIDYGSITKVPGDLIELITNEQGLEGLRFFNGYAFSDENYFVDNTFGGKILKALSKTKKLSRSIFDGLLGFISWRKYG